MRLAGSSGRKRTQEERHSIIPECLVLPALSRFQARITPHHRDAAGSAVGLGAQLGGAMAANILKEFWPDLLRKISRKH